MPEPSVDLHAEIFLLKSDWSKADRLREELAAHKSAALVLFLPCTANP